MRIVWKLKDYYGTCYYTLKFTEPNYNLLVWDIGGRQETLFKRSRYLLIDRNTGRFGWVAFNKMQLTQFGTGVRTRFSANHFRSDYVKLSALERINSDEANMEASFSVKEQENEDLSDLIKQQLVNSSRYEKNNFGFGPADFLAGRG